MSTRNDYPCDEAINDLEQFFRKHISDPDTLKQFIDYLTKCRSSQKLGFRYVHEKLMNYRKQYSDYFRYTDAERKMIDDLMYFWG